MQLQSLQEALQTFAGAVEALSLRVCRLEEQGQADALDLWLPKRRPQNGTVQGADTVESEAGSASLLCKSTLVASLDLGRRASTARTYWRGMC